MSVAPGSHLDALPRVSIQPEDFDVSAECAALRRGRTDIGAVVSFIGTVRQSAGAHALSALELEHYPGMTEHSIEGMIDDAVARFGLRAARVVHRVGRLLPGEQIVLVLAASAHRKEAFAGCEFLMDYLKTQAPFWKKEHVGEQSHWVDARVDDDAALARWGLSSSNASAA